VGARFSAPVQTGPGAHPAFCTICTRSFPGVKSGRGVTLTPHLLVPLVKIGAIPIIPLWAVRSVHSLSACTRVHFTFTFYLFGRSRVHTSARRYEYSNRAQSSFPQFFQANMETHILTDNYLLLSRYFQFTIHIPFMIPFDIPYSRSVQIPAAKSPW
jgi:hypothetical protein